MYNPYPPGNIYVNGYGFVTEDPSFREKRAIRRKAAAVGLVLICLLVLPVVSVYPIHLFLDVMFAPLRYTAVSSAAAAGVQMLYQALSRLLVSAVSLGLPFALASFLLRPQGRKPLFRAPSPKIFRFAPWVCIGVWILAEMLCQGVEAELRFVRLLELHPQNALPANPVTAFFYIIHALLLPAILEEALFRGIILRSLRQFGDSFAIVAAAAAFGLAQYTLTGSLRAFILGLALGYFVIRSGSAWTAVFSRLACLLLEAGLALVPRLFSGSQVDLVRNILLFLCLALAVFCFARMCLEENSPFILRDSPTGTRMAVRLRRFFSSGFLILAALVWLVQIGLSLQFIG